jgi:hypothetical protein
MPQVVVNGNFDRVKSAKVVEYGSVGMGSTGARFPVGEYLLAEKRIGHDNNCDPAAKNRQTRVTWGGRSAISVPIFQKIGIGQGSAAREERHPTTDFTSPLQRYGSTNETTWIREVVTNETRGDFEQD